MKHRDYFAMPVQSGGRTGHDYGRTVLGCQHEPKKLPVGLYIAIFAAFVLLCASVI